MQDHKAGPPKVELQGVSLRYISYEGVTEALSDISFAVWPGEFVSIVGPSGCGKSTCLSLIAGIMRPSAGAVFVDGEPVTGPNRRLGYMLQHDHLFEWRDVLGNVLIGPEILGLDRQAARARALNLLERYGLADFQHRFPHHLSGGMRQRVALIRTLTINPDVLLLDEPFSALDYQTRLALADEVTGILRQEGKTAILVTHDISEAIAMSDRVLVISHRPGRIKAEHAIGFAAGRVAPFTARQQPEFQDYFQTIWKELDIHVHR